MRTGKVYISALCDFALRWLWALFFISSVVHASSGSIPSEPKALKVFQSLTCQGLQRKPSVRFLSKKQLHELLSLQAENQGKLLEAEGKLVLVNMGERSSSGYGVSLVEGGTRIENGILRLSVDWRSPSPGMFSAQMITHPCLVVSMEGQFQNVEVLDQFGNLQLSTLDP